ncbi:alpha/beta hydrolase [Phenylobacterium sp.]|uniref:alpha/beta hydrolase n=1 Tax=Phenylobacterium sp. TaxID=1871053 RepID=UPI003566D1C4
MQTLASLGPTTISRCNRYSLASRNVDQTFLIDVAMPAAPLAPGQAVPVVYVLDGNVMFAMAAQAARMMQSGGDPLPPFLIVGVGYQYRRGGGPNWEYVGLRCRDYSPTSDPWMMAALRASPPPYGVPEDFQLGGAAAFLAFFNEELKPFIAANYAVEAGDQTPLGFSLGGLFALNTLFTAPGSFNRYIAGSPALAWDGRVMFDREAALAATAKDLSADLFLSVGGLEEDEDGGASTARVSNLAAMEAALRGRRYPSLRMTHHVFPDETHFSVMAATISRGIRTVFARPSDARTAAPDA